MLLFMSLSLRSQQILMLEKLGSGKHYQYGAGDPITMKRVADSSRFTGTITAIYDSGFIIDQKLWVSLEDVQSVWRKSPHRKKQGTRVMIGSGALAAIIMINNAAHGNVVVDPYVGAAAGVTALGALWSASSVQRYPVGKKWKLKILETKFL